MNINNYKNGELLTTDELKGLANSGTKVLYENNICTVKFGKFTSCEGKMGYGYSDKYTLRFEKISSKGATWCASLDHAIYEAILIEDKEETEFIKYSGIFLHGNTDIKCELVCNQAYKEMYIDQLERGESFYIANSKDYLTFSIEEAIKIKDYLIQMIGIAKESGYFDEAKEMTLKEIQKELGYKIKLV